MIMVYSVTKDEEGVYFIECSNWGGERKQRQNKLWAKQVVQHGKMRRRPTPRIPTTQWKEKTKCSRTPHGTYAHCPHTHTRQNVEKKQQGKWETTSDTKPTVGAVPHLGVNPGHLLWVSFVGPVTSTPESKCDLALAQSYWLSPGTPLGAFCCYPDNSIICKGLSTTSVVYTSRVRN